MFYILIVVVDTRVWKCTIIHQIGADKPMAITQDFKNVRNISLQ